MNHFMQSIAEGRPCANLVYADYLEESGEQHLATWLRDTRNIANLFTPLAPFPDSDSLDRIMDKEFVTPANPAGDGISLNCMPDGDGQNVFAEWGDGDWEYLLIPHDGDGRGASSLGQGMGPGNGWAVNTSRRRILET